MEAFSKRELRLRIVSKQGGNKNVCVPSVKSVVENIVIRVKFEIFKVVNLKISFP